MVKLIKLKDVEKITFMESEYSDPINVLTEVRDRVRELPIVNAIILPNGMTKSEVCDYLENIVSKIEDRGNQLLFSPENMSAIDSIIEYSNTLASNLYPNISHCKTNGDAIITMFPNCDIRFFTNLSGMKTVIVTINDNTYDGIYATHTFSRDWWDSPFISLDDEKEK